MKKFTALFLLSSIFLNLWGYSIYYILMKIDLEIELSTIDITCINIPLEKIKFKLVNGKIVDNEFKMKEANEFEYKNKMYDVLKKESDGEYITFYCLNDKKEEELKNNLLTQLEKNSQTEKNINPEKFKLKKCIYSDEFKNILIFYQEKEYYHPNYLYIKSYQLVENPPPKVV